ncbi:MAG: hypothetical protein JSW16_00150 [Dehalococcoidales bacterium]|nr:MAG: hypothetical protein JSW16_00150 [Dehalococcoidales bacterium]
MRNYADYILAGKMAKTLNLFNRMTEGLQYLISLRVLGEATQRVRLQPEVVRINREYLE